MTQKGEETRKNGEEREQKHCTVFILATLEKKGKKKTITTTAATKETFTPNSERSVTWAVPLSKIQLFCILYIYIFFLKGNVLNVAKPPTSAVMMFFIIDRINILCCYRKPAYAENKQKPTKENKTNVALRIYSSSISLNRSLALYFVLCY